MEKGILILSLNLKFNTFNRFKFSRFPWYAEYSLGVDNNGAILGQKITLYVDCGNSPNDNAIGAAPSYIDNAYSCKNYLISFKLAKTNLPANTACRSPGRKIIINSI